MTHSASSVATVSAITLLLPLAASAQSDYTGFNAGIYTSLGMPSAELSRVDPDFFPRTGTLDGSIVSGGVFLGYDYAVGGWIVGSRLSTSLTQTKATDGSLDGSSWCSALACNPSDDISEDFELTMDNRIAIIARAGQVISNGAFVYGLAGVTWADATIEAPDAVINDDFDPNLGAQLSFEEQHTGYVVGLGYEQKLSQSYFIFGEVAYTNFGEEEYVRSDSPTGLAFGDIDLSEFSVNLGLGIRF
ncbi:MAG: outer membrane beta-barrel protein [Pseudomonadota bacterium]